MIHEIIEIHLEDTALGAVASRSFILMCWIIIRILIRIGIGLPLLSAPAAVMK